VSIPGLKPYQFLSLL